MKCGSSFHEKCVCFALPDSWLALLLSHLCSIPSSAICVRSMPSSQKSGYRGRISSGRIQDWSLSISFHTLVAMACLEHTATFGLSPISRRSEHSWRGQHLRVPFISARFKCLIFKRPTSSQTQRWPNQRVERTATSRLVLDADREYEH